MEWLRSRAATPAGRGLVLLTLATALFGFALNAQQTVVANFFEDGLSLSGPEFGYITAIREIPGFLLIFLTALFYRVSLPRVTAGAFVLMAIGYSLFGTATSFWTVVPWVIISSMGYHTFLQTQYALGMSITTEARSGSILGQMTTIYQGGSLLAMLFTGIAFYFGLLSFAGTFVICGLLAAVAAFVIWRFPSLQNGEAIAREAQRQPIVLRREYRYYYLLSLLDGGRQQIFFSFGLWVLVNHFGLEVTAISAILLVATALGVVAGRPVGRSIDRYGERPVLAAINIAYIIALGGYALIDNVYVAALCFIIYSFIMPLSPVGAATYLRKVAAANEIAPSLAMGVTMQHAAAVVVPILAGYVLNYVDYPVPFLIACVFSCLTIVVTRRLAPEQQKSPLRIQEEALRAS
jgi:predicted MFS family arabinose efflux permease